MIGEFGKRRNTGVSPLRRQKAPPSVEMTCFGGRGSENNENIRYDGPTAGPSTPPPAIKLREASLRMTIPISVNHLRLAYMSIPSRLYSTYRVTISISINHLRLAYMSIPSRISWGQRPSLQPPCLVHLQAAVLFPPSILADDFRGLVLPLHDSPWKFCLYPHSLPEQFAHPIQVHCCIHVEFSMRQLHRARRTQQLARARIAPQLHQLAEH